MNARPDEGMFVVIYCRVSTDDKDQTNDTQERVCRQWCEQQGMKILDVYRDEVSGTTLERPDFSRMFTRIMMKKDVDYIVAYDQSRITRSDNFDEIKEMFSTARCRFRFVNMDVDTDSLPGQIVSDIFSRVNTHENKVRNEKTHLGMETKKIAGYHVGRPAKFMFSEDIDDAPKGRYDPDSTKAYHEADIYAYASKGYSLYKLATKILGIDCKTLICEMRPRDPSDPKCRNKGTKDRYTPYMSLLRQYLEQDKGCAGERVGNDPETTGERVVS